MVETHFVRGDERWSAVDNYGREGQVSYNSVSQNIGITSLGRDKMYFSAPGMKSSLVNTT